MSEEKPTYLIPGEPCKEEVDGHLHALNRARSRVTEAARAYRRSEGKSVAYCWLDLVEALDEYEKLVGGA